MCFFVILKLKKQYINEPIVEIPPEIYDRMLFNTQKFVRVLRGLNLMFTGSAIDVSVNKDEQKYFLYSNVNIYETETYLTGFFILKDV